MSSPVEKKQAPLSGESEPHILDATFEAAEMEVVRSLEKSTSFTMPRKDHLFGSLIYELHESPQYRQLTDRDSDALSSFADSLSYKLENAIAANSRVTFYVLIVISAVLCCFMAFLWTITAGKYSIHHSTTDSIGSALFMTFQVLITGGYSEVFEVGPCLVFFFMILAGVTLVSILIGLITDSVNEYMESLSAGSSKVVEEGHTLILGWNKATVRAICQIAFLREVLYVQNQTFARKYLRMGRALPASPVVTSPVVVMNNTMEKEDMERIVRDSFGARNVNTECTLVGRDVVFRKGDPANQHDLVRAAAHKATSILIMMTLSDRVDAEASQGYVQNNVTLHVILSLRNVIYSSLQNGDGFNPALRVVVQLSASCPYLDAVSFTAPDGHNVLYAQDLFKFINSHMFVCASKPGLSRVLLELLNFQGTAMRTRRSTNLRGGPRQELGWFVGKTMQEAMLNHGWANSVLIGCDDGILNQPLKDMTFKDRPGVVADPNRILKHDDHLIFVSRTSTPPLVDAADLKDFAKEAAPFIHSAKRKATTDPESLLPRHILIVGWRELWNQEPTRFKQRMWDLSQDLPKGSTITTFNVQTKEKMAEFCAKLGLKPTTVTFRSRGGPREGGSSTDITEKMPAFQVGPQKTRLIHFQGDAVKLDAMRDLMQKVAFHTAVVFGTMFGVELDAACQDGRTLQLLLSIRQVCAELGQTMHVIAENELDQTSTLALGPQHGDNTPSPDFINTQGLIARTLVFNLAFPQVWDAVFEIISTEVGTPDIDLLHPKRLDILDKTLSFGALQHVVNHAYAGSGVTVGFTVGRELAIAPALARVETFTDEFRIVVISRAVVAGNSEDVNDDSDDEDAGWKQVHPWSPSSL